MFYYIWHGQHGTSLHDISKILQQNPPRWDPAGAFHFWTEPLYGYYKSDDPWIIRKNAQMLTDAGVDVIFLDVTNGATYNAVYTKLCETYMEIRQNDARERGKSRGTAAPNKSRSNALPIGMTYSLNTAMTSLTPFTAMPRAWEASIMSTTQAATTSNCSKSPAT